MAKVLLICAVFLATVVAHNYVITPVDRGNNNVGGSTTGPCPTTTPQPTPWQTVRTGSPIAVTWSTNHGPPNFTLNILNDDYSSTGVTATFPYPTASGTISYDANSSPGHKIVQFTWGPFFSCFDVTALATLPGTIPCDASQACADNVVSLPSKDGTFDESTGVLTCKAGCAVNAAKTDCTCGGSIAGKGIGGFNPFSLALVVVACAGIPVLAVAMVANSFRKPAAAPGYSAEASPKAAPAAAKAAPAGKAAPVKAAPAAAAAATAGGASYKAGDTVNALFKAENKWYPAKVIKGKGAGVFVVQFEGFPEYHDLKENMIAPM